MDVQIPKNFVKVSDADFYSLTDNLIVWFVNFCGCSEIYANGYGLIAFCNSARDGFYLNPKKFKKNPATPESPLDISP